MSEIKKIKHYKEQKNLKCCINCINSKVDEAVNELYCYLPKKRRNVSYTGICDEFENFNDTYKKVRKPKESKILMKHTKMLER